MLWVHTCCKLFSRLKAKWTLDCSVGCRPVWPEAQNAALWVRCTSQIDKFYFKLFYTSSFSFSLILPIKICSNQVLAYLFSKKFNITLMYVPNCLSTKHKIIIITEWFSVTAGTCSSADSSAATMNYGHHHNPQRLHRPPCLKLIF